MFLVPWAQARKQLLPTKNVQLTSAAGNTYHCASLARKIALLLLTATPAKRGFRGLLSLFNYVRGAPMHTILGTNSSPKIRYMLMWFEFIVICFMFNLLHQHILSLFVTKSFNTFKVEGAEFIKKSLQKGIIELSIPNDLSPRSLAKWRDASHYNSTLVHYMGYYDKGYTLCEYFANLDKNEFNEFVKSTNGFGSTFLHEAVGQNNVKLLQNIFENQDNQVLFVLKDYFPGCPK